MNWKKALLDMKPYKPGRSIEEVVRELGITKIVKLASNENPYGCSPLVEKSLSDNAIQCQIYPDATASALRAKLAEKHGVNPQQLLLGNGSDEIVAMISRALLHAQSNTIMADTTFPQYAHYAKIDGAKTRQIPLKDGFHDLDAFIEAIDDQTSVIWICNPNNPTGNLMASDELLQFLRQIPSHILVVLDEAYFEYITDPNHIDSIQWLLQFPNLIVLRTFSKAYGLAAHRVGYAVGHVDVITELNKVRNPFNNNSIGQLAAVSALEDEAFIVECRQKNEQQRQRFEAYAQQHQLHLYPSETNFVLIEVPIDADEASEKLLEQGYIVRSGNLLGTPGYVRITIGSADENTGLFRAFDTILTKED